MFFVYMIRCEDNSLYTGYTTDIERRLSEHLKQDKKGAKYTKLRKVVKLEALWKCESRSVAMSLEYFIKKLKKQDKEAIIREPKLLIEISQEKFRGKIVEEINKNLLT